MKSIILAALASLTLASTAHADDFSDQILSVHNRERAEVGTGPLNWNDDLARDAQVWANHLASIGTLEHAGRDVNPNSGENLWMGTAGAYDYAQMAQGWADEKSWFRYGTFPDVSSDGNWASVGHYTQMIWKNTTEVGCAVATGGGWDVLVCRYNPPGNYMGEKPY